MLTQIEYTKFHSNHRETIFDKATQVMHDLTYKEISPALEMNLRNKEVKELFNASEVIGSTVKEIIHTAL